MAQIHWTGQVDADFNTAGDWSTGAVPGSGDQAILDAPGSTSYTVTTSTAENVAAIELASTATLLIEARTFTATAGTGPGANAGTIEVGNNAYFAIGGGVDNTGSISVDSVGNDTRLIVASNATFSGGGQVTLSDNSNNTVIGATAGATLFNVNDTLSGAGALGGGQMTLVNQAKGVIDATGVNALVLDTGSRTVANAGLIEATGTGGLTIVGTAVNGRSGGVLLANAGSAINLQSAEIIGGVLKTVAGGVIQAVDRGSVLNGANFTVDNTGQLLVDNDDYLTVEGTIDNLSTIGVESGGNDTRLVIGTAGATLTGGGDVTLTDNANNTIGGSSTTATLTNVNNTISGAGDVGGGQLALVNRSGGVIEATGVNALVLNMGAGVVSNAGLLEGVGAAGLTISATTVENTVTGVLLAGAASSVNLQSADIVGGELTTSGTGVIQAVDRGSLLDGTTSIVTNAGQLVIDNNDYLTIAGTIDNTGTIGVDSGGNDTRLVIGAAGATLTGGGQVVLSANVNNSIVGDAAAATLVNGKSTISGAGALGHAQMTLVNTNAGIIDATGPAGDALVLDTAGRIVRNAGLLEATGAGGLTIQSTTVNGEAVGVIEAMTGATVDLVSADIVGGILKTAGTGTILAADRGSLIDGRKLTVDNTGQLDVANNDYLTIEGLIDNGPTAVIGVDSIGNDTRLIIGAGNATVVGGAVILSDNVNNSLTGTVSGSSVSTLVNKTTISGAGSVGLNLILDNDGAVDATGASALVLATGGSGVAGSNVVSNAGVLEATNPGGLSSTGGLTLSSIVVANSDGRIVADGPDTHVNLQSSTIDGGALTGLNGGVIETADRASVIDGLASSVTLSGEVEITNNLYLTVEGAIDNTDLVDIDSGGNDTRLILGTNTTFSGGGDITLSDNSNNTLEGASSATVLTNVDNVISGAGQLGASQMTLVNEAKGVVDADGATALILDTGSQTLVNDGVIEATGSGGLLILNTTVNDAASALFAYTGSALNLQSADIIGGALDTFGSGVIQTADRGSTLDGRASAITIDGQVDVTNNLYLTVEGAIDNTDLIDIGSTGNDTRLILAANTTFSGGGDITLSDNPNNTLEGVSAATVLTNVDNVISGAGQLGAAQTTLINEKRGVIDANGSNALRIQSTTPVINDGVIEATGSGGLLILATTVKDAASALLADSGSVLMLQSADIIGGALETLGSGSVQIVDRGSTLDGRASAFTIKAQVDIDNNQYLTVEGTVVNDGVISVGSTGNDTRLILGASTTFSGGGQITLSDNPNNTLEGVSAATVLTNVDNVISGAGQLGAAQTTLINEKHGVIDADGSNALRIQSTTPVINDGVIAATGTGGLVILDTTVNDAAGSIVAESGSSITLQSADIVGGRFALSGSATIQIVDRGSILDGRTSSVTTSGQIDIQNNEYFYLEGVIANEGDISVDSGGNDTRLILAANTTLSGGGQVTLSDNANNTLEGEAATTVLTNVNNVISGAGQFGAGQMTLINQVGGVIDADGGNALILNTGAETVSNAGLIETVGAGGLTIESAIDNTGILEADGGVLAADAAVTGAGSGLIVGGTLDFASTFNQNVTFDAVAGSLELAQSQSYGGVITGFSSHGAAGVDTLDLEDISFVSANEASFSGTAAGGTLTVTDGNHTASIALKGNYTQATFVASSDGHGGADITVNTTTPVALADAYTASAGQVLNVGAAAGVLADDVDPNGLTLTAALAPGGGPQHGSLTLNSNGSFTYTPVAGFSGTDSFTYIASDKNASAAPATVVISVVATAPTTAASQYSDSAGQTLKATAATGVLSGASDPNGLGLAAALAPGGGPSHGTLTLNANGAFTYTPDSGFVGTDSFTWVASDSLATSAPTTVTITVAARAPTAVASSYTVAAGHDLAVSAASGVLVKDTDPNGLALTAVLASGGAPAHGILSLGADGAFTYSPDAGFAGNDTFSYVASDGLTTSAITTVTVTVVASAPTTQPETYAALAGQPLVVDANGGVLAGDTDPNGVALTAVLASGGGPTHGVLTLNADGSFSYTPDSGFKGADSFTYVATDGLASSAPTTVTIEVGVSAPVSNPDSYSDAAGHALTTTAATGVLANDTDPNGLPLTAALAPGDGPAHGTLTLNADGSFTYTPDLGFAGKDSFSYIASDGLASGPVTIVTLTVSASPPQTAPASYTDGAGHTLTTTAATGVLTNDTDPNGLSLTAALAPGGGPAHGTLTLNANGSFTYRPDNGFTGTDSFTYIASDSLASSAATTVTLNVDAGTPITSPASYAASAGHALTTTAANGVLANDTDPNGLPMTAALALGGGPAHGTLTLNANGSFTYTPNLGFAGKDTFSYVASDALGSSSPTLVTLTVAASPPATVSSSYGDAAGQTLTTTAATGVLANDTDPNGLTLTAALAAAGGPAHGTLTLNANGSFTYTPNVGFAGKDSFSYIASDSLASSSATTVTITVGAGSPVTVPESYAASAGHAFSTTAANGVLADDTDPNGLSLTAALAPGGGPAHGSLTLNANGSFTYTPDLGFAGKDSFSFIASDSLASSAPTTVTLTVTASRPVAVSESYNDTIGRTLTTTAATGVLADDTDPNGLALTAALAQGGGPTHGTLVLNANGSFTYTPVSGFVGKDSFTYVASDALASSPATTVTITVAGGPPVTKPETYDAIANQTLTVDAQDGVLANDTDPNGLPLTATLAPGGGPLYGTLKLNPDGSFTYILNAGFGGFVGTDTFSYIASDGVASSAPTLVTIDVSNGSATAGVGALPKPSSPTDAGPSATPSSHNLLTATAVARARFVAAMASLAPAAGWQAAALGASQTRMDSMLCVPARHSAA